MSSLRELMEKALNMARPPIFLIPQWMLWNQPPKRPKKKWFTAPAPYVGAIIVILLYC